MQKFNTLKSIPAYLPIVNIDTDMIIPKQFLKTIKRTGLGKSLFFEMRYDHDGKKIKDFISVYKVNFDYSENNLSIAYFGVTFKPDVEDLRESPALKVVEVLGIISWRSI